METNMNELKQGGGANGGTIKYNIPENINVTGGSGSDGTIHDLKDYEVVSDKKIIDSKTFIPMQLKTLQEEEKAIIIGGIVMTCGNTFDENGKEMSARLGDYICYVVEQERQKSYTLGMMKGVEKKEIEWEKTRDELYTYFGKCPCGATSVIVGSKYCNECGSLIINPLIRSSETYNLKQELK